MNSLSGNILLERDHGNFKAGFCIIKDKLPALTAHFSLLHPKEHAYYSTLKADSRRESYLMGRYAAKFAVSQLAEVGNMQSLHIDSGIFQFPVVKSQAPLSAGNMQVCISHCEHFGAALAFPEAHPLGMDLEQIDTEKATLIKDHLTVKEKELVAAASMPDRVGYLLMWTAKEALSKVLRTGLTLNMNILEIDSWQTEGSLHHTTFRNFSQYKTISCCSGHHVCSVVVPGRTTSQLDNFWRSFVALSNEISPGDNLQ